MPGNGRGAVGEAVIGPEDAQHRGQMGLTGAVEARNPHALLLRLGEPGQIGSQDPLEAFPVFPLADERLQLVAQHGQGVLGVVLGHLGHALVEQPVLGGFLDVEVPVLHVLPLNDGQSVTAIGSAR